MRSLIGVISLFALLSSGARAADWPDGPWINGQPRSSAAISAIAFVSPLDLQFQRMMHIWRKLDRRYSSLDVEFLIVAMQEPIFPFSEFLVQSAAKDANYSLPIFIDNGARYSKLWRAYVSPTVNLVLKNGKVTSFDPGNFDPFIFERTLQKLLKEIGTVTLPPKEYVVDVDLKNCHPHTLFTGSRFQKAWSSAAPTYDDQWEVQPFWVERAPLPKPSSTQPSAPHAAQIEVGVTRSEVGLLAESRGGTARINVLWDGQRVPAELRGRDLQEDRFGATFTIVSSARVYEIIAHGSRARESQSKLSLSTESKGLKIWAFQFLPSCME